MVKLSRGTSCSGCVVEACVSCTREPHCDLVEEACTVCVETDSREEVEALLRQVERCREDGAFAGGFGGADDAFVPDDAFYAY